MSAYAPMILTCWILIFGAAAQAQVTGGPPSTSLPTSADGGNIGSGKLSFQPDLFTGRFTYTVPIDVPPGRGGSQPGISLNYNSSLGNGWCGVGWQLELGKIERETRFGVPISYTNGGYDDSKSFTVDLGGVNGHLIEVSPANQSPEQYRLQVDKSFLNFLFCNNVSNAYWQVTDKNGTQYFFGESSSNSVSFPGTAGGFGTKTFRWDLDRIIDANGNETFITYTNIPATNDVGGQLYPLRVSYNASASSPSLPATDTVDFILTNRSDQVSSYLSDFRLEYRNLLSQIVVKANGQPVRRYVLSYTNSPSTLRSLLSSVTEYGADNTTALPPITFNYQVQQMGFGPLQSWAINSEGETNAAWNSITASDNNGNMFVKFIDVDGDGLPDRVLQLTNSPYNGFIVQRNTGSNFVGNYFWGGLTNSANGCISAVSNNITSVDFFDINGDGRPDYVMNNTSSNWLVQLNTGDSGTSAFSAPILWGGLVNGGDIHKETVYDTEPPLVVADEEIWDTDANGLPDRVFNGSAQLNTGGGFNANTFGSFGFSSMVFVWQSDPLNSGAWYQTADMNGDGLPDWVNENNSVLPNLQQQEVVDYDNGSASLVYQPLEGDWVNYLNSAIDLIVNSMNAVELLDITGDGLPARVMTINSNPYNRLEIQMNTGYGFSPLMYWTNVLSQAGPDSQVWDSIGYSISNDTVVALMDINGDGLPDRIMCPTNAPYTNWWVQLNLGPFPDLLCGVSNGLGGSVAITYTPSTRYDNTDRAWTNDPWAEGAKSLLPFPVYTVSSIAVNDGMGDVATNTYTYKHGFFDHVSREFRGFNEVAVTDPYGAKTVTYFHQSGGFDDSADGEFEDQGSFAKKGMPYRVETWGTNGELYQIVLNKVMEDELNSNGWYFPFIAQTIVMNYEGLANYRATAVQYTYDTNTENLVEEADLGEVGNVVVDGQTFTDIGNDSVFKWITYTNIGNILDRPSDIKTTSDSAGADRLRETVNGYDGNGNLLSSASWLNTSGNFITTVQNQYDQYGNLKQTTDAANITTSITYDSTFEQFPVSQTTGPYTSYSTFDNRSGEAMTSTDIKGLVTSNSYDAFFRPTATYISTNTFGAPTLWQTKTAYVLAGISGNISSNCTISQVNDAVDPVNGFVTYTYADGLGRTIETRDESETANQYRVANTAYDLRGDPVFDTLSYLLRTKLAS